MQHLKLFRQHIENTFLANAPSVIDGVPQVPARTEKRAFGFLAHTSPDDTHEKDSHLLFSGVSLYHLIEFPSSQ